MRALLCTRLGPASGLSVGEVDDPQPGPGEVVVDVEAAGLNFPDTLIIEGRYQFKPELPFTPGGEAAGTVSAVGDGVTSVAVGDRVIALSAHGAFAQRWAVDARKVIPIPVGLDAVAAAAFGLTYGTSYHALKDRAALQPGETLLVLGAAGGVGSAAVELGKAMGATVIAAASSAEKLAWAMDLGADEAIDYSSEDLRDGVRRITGARGVDVVYDPVGGNLTETAVRSTAWNGRLLVVGFAAGDIPAIPLNLTLLKGMSIVGVFWGRSMEEEPELHRGNFAELAGMIEAGRIRPRVSAEFDLDDYEAAFAMFTERRVMGKAVFRIG
ncbi:MAG TPA: NADPH:quinone oxidoreductase family protein [Acidimicrobiia bacterium]|nr:NADPH:quinone oxidoreductase family protein [Acidimicrobiia bacterium]